MEEPQECDAAGRFPPDRSQAPAGRGETLTQARNLSGECPLCHQFKLAYRRSDFTGYEKSLT